MRWGFRAEDVGLVTGNRRVNPEARVLVVVAEILLNRLLHPEGVRFQQRLGRRHGRVPQLRRPGARHRLGTVAGDVAEAHPLAAPVRDGRQRRRSSSTGSTAATAASSNWSKSKDRKIPLTYHWVPDQFLGEQLVEMAKGEARRARCRPWSSASTAMNAGAWPSNSRACRWSATAQKPALHAEVNKLEWTQGVGPKMKQMLHRGVGVHHAGLLPKYRRVVEELFQRKLWPWSICTETLASGINLPARSVVLTSLVKGPFGKEKLIDAEHRPSDFRPGRPAAVRRPRATSSPLPTRTMSSILRWKEKYDQIPEDTRDPGLLKAKKDLKRKKPTRSETRHILERGAVQAAQAAPPGKLYSKGPLPWRLLAYLLEDLAGGVAGARGDPQTADGRSRASAPAKRRWIKCC